MPIVKETFGKTKDGGIVDRYTLSNKNNVSVSVLSYGGLLTDILVPDKNGKIDDISLGFDSLQEWEDNQPFLGAFVGRVCNRIANGQFTLDGSTYDLVVNNGPNHLHGGTVGFNKVLWSSSCSDSQVTMFYWSKDGEEGYPGDVVVKLTYELSDDNELMIDATAISNKATPLNLTNHSYFNLAGQGSKNVYDHAVTINSGKYLEKNEHGVPTGEELGTEGTVFNFTSSTPIGDRINDAPSADRGFDHSFVLPLDKKRKFAARVDHAESGRTLEVYTTEPNVHLYTGNYLDGVKGKGGSTYNQHSGFCLECQNYVNAINMPNFPNCVLRPGETHRQTTWYKFITNKA